jgi:hypothetical protein
MKTPMVRRCVFAKGSYFRGFTQGAGHQLAPAVAEIPRPAQISIFHPVWIIVSWVETAVVRYDGTEHWACVRGDLAGKGCHY